MDQLTLNYSMKNIPIPSKKLYLKCLTEKVELVIKRMRWKALFNDQGLESGLKDNFGFKSTKCPPQHPDLTSFENDLLDMIQKHLVHLSS